MAGGKLRSGVGRGTEVHAGSSIPKRRIVLDSALLDSPAELGRILIHEIFHFVWVRLGNPQRCSWERILRDELDGRARGELGWSAESRKARLNRESVRERSPAWRAYICESFCDTAGWLLAGVRRHEEFTLAGGWRRKRRHWFQQAVGGRTLPI